MARKKTIRRSPKLKRAAEIAALLVGLFVFLQGQGWMAGSPEATAAIPTSIPVSPEVSEGFPKDFEASKTMLMRIHAENPYEIYCGCRFQAESGKRWLDASCPVEVESHQERAKGIEWEHVVAASDFGRQRPCWRQAPEGVSGRDHCGEVDSDYRRMEADPHNLWPAVGALNALRSNYRFGMVPRASTNQFGACGFKMEDRVVEPPDAAKGLVARSYFYMEQRYGLRISDSQRRVFDAWHRQFPPTDWELRRAAKIEALTGVRNPFLVKN